MNEVADLIIWSVSNWARCDMDFKELLPMILFDHGMLVFGRDGLINLVEVPFGLLHLKKS